MTRIVMPLIFIIGLFLFTPCFAAEEGKPAPEFKAKLFSGEEFTLAGDSGHVVIIHFWASWCEACQVEMSVLDHYFKAHQADGLKLIAVDMDEVKDQAKARDIMKAFGFSAAAAKDSSFKASALKCIQASIRGFDSISWMKARYLILRRNYSKFTCGFDVFTRRRAED